MTNIEFFKQQAKLFFKDYKTRVFNENEGFYEYKPRFFDDLEEILYDFEIHDDDDFTLMNAQHIIAQLAGFKKWNDLIKASDAALELGKLLIENRQKQNSIFIDLLNEWKSYESTFLSEFDDEAKLEVFKDIFLNEKTTKNESILLNFKNEAIAQDMIKTIMQEKNISAEKAITSSITQKICIRILETGYASFALSQWRHAEGYPEMQKLEDPIIRFKLTEGKARLLSVIIEREQVSFGEAIQYFLLFYLESLGHHI